MKINIKTAREHCNMTQKECSDILNIALRTWQTYEQGTREPKYETLCNIADLFNVSTDYLLGRETKSDTENDKSTRIKECLKTINDILDEE